jgi:hypothetical protein
VEGENDIWRCAFWLTRVALKFGGKCLATLERDRRETDKSLTFSISQQHSNSPKYCIQLQTLLT